MLLLVDTPQFSLAHQPAEACLYASWQGHHSGQLTQANYELILHYIGQTHSTKLLNDGLLDKNGWAEITGWLAQEWFTYLAHEGIQAVAWVLPRDPHAFYDTWQVVRHLQQPLVDTFVDAEAAYHWLHAPETLRSAGMTKTLTGFLALPATEQLLLLKLQGQLLPARWEGDYYVESYQLPTNLLVVVRYHQHSGLLYQVQASYIL